MSSPVTLIKRPPILSVPDSLRNTIEMITRLRMALRLDVYAAIDHMASKMGERNGWDHIDRARFAREAEFAFNWRASGCQIFTLTHSMAAMLATTRSPPIDFSRLPHQAFLIETPTRFLPMPSTYDRSTRFVGVIGAGAVATDPKTTPIAAGMILAIPDGDTLSNTAAFTGGRPLDEGAPFGRSAPKLERFGNQAERDETAISMQLAIRLASNVIAFVSEHRPCVRLKSKPGTTPVVHEVRAPSDVTVDREFRDLAAAVVAATDIAGARRALAHMVRGHWRNQAAGPGRAERRLIWIRPHRRGDTAAGVVVEKTSRLGELVN